VNQIPWASFRDKVFRSFERQETAFDIVVGDSRWIGRGAVNGLYLDLTKWLPKAVSTKYIHSRILKSMCAYPAGSRNYFAAPCEPDAVGFAYRRDWFEDPAEKAAFKKKYRKVLKVPDTWDEFKRVAEFFNRPNEGRSGCALLTGREAGVLTAGFQPFLFSFGGSWGDEKKFKAKGRIDGKDAVKALTFMKELLDFSPRGGGKFGCNDAIEAFGNGSTAIAMGYFTSFPAIVKRMGDKVGFFRVPKKGERRFTSLGGQAFSISARISEERQDMAKKFIIWFLKTRTQSEWIAKPAGFTANTSVLASKEFRKGASYNEAFAKSLDCVRDFWGVPASDELLSASQKLLGEALDGEKTPQQALTALAEAQEKIFIDSGLAKPPKAAGKPAKKQAKQTKKKGKKR
jgi:multiple sugar transport system substrate-binding protein